MKKIVSLLFLILFYANTLLSQVGIGTNTPSASAQLDVSSTERGFLPPRMTAAQRDLIATPATGLLIFQTDNTSGYYYYDGSAWVNLGAMGPQGPQGPAGSSATTSIIPSLSIYDNSGNSVCYSGSLSRIAGFSSATQPTVYTPSKVGTLDVDLSFWYDETRTGQSAAIQFYLIYGTGNVPTVGDLASNYSYVTLCDVKIKSAVAITNLPANHEVCLRRIITGLTVGTQYWFDVIPVATGGTNGTCVKSYTFNAMELASSGATGPQGIPGNSAQSSQSQGTRIGFAASTTWTCPANVSQITLEVWGGAGGGGGSSFAKAYYGQLNSNATIVQGGAGGNGGAGGYTKSTISVTPNQTYSITIGGGGSGGNGGNHTINLQATDGTNGNPSSFSNLVSAPSGNGGLAGMVYYNSNVWNSTFSNGVNGVSGAINGLLSDVFIPNSTQPRTYIPVGYYNNVANPALNNGGAGGVAITAAYAGPGNYGNNGSNGESGFLIISY
jgi:hypothetical protein